MDAWVNSFWQCNMQKCVIRTNAGDQVKKNWQILIFNNQIISGIFQFLEEYMKYLEQYIHQVVLRFFCQVYVQKLPYYL